MNASQPTCAIITGASQGLGKAFAEECAARGMDCVLVALPCTGLPELASLLGRAYGVRVTALEMDLTSAEAPRTIRDAMQDAGLAPDLLINNAGVGFNARFSDASPFQNETTIQLNVAGFVRLTQALLPGLRRARRSWVLNVASLGAVYAMPSMPVYSASKRFILELSLLLRAELRRDGVSVSVLCPNGIRTNRGARELIARQGLAGRLTCHYPDEVARAGLAGVLRGRAVIVPGAMNRFLRRVRPLVPAGLYLGLITRRWAAEEKAPRGAGAPKALGVRA
jgi:short-subunit dehydrogenase